VAKRRYSAEQVATALREARGLRSIAAERLGCSRGTVDQYVDRYPQVAAAAHAARTEVFAAAVVALQRAIDAGEPWAIALSDELRRPR
jgi:hypothetical protein